MPGDISASKIQKRLLTCFYCLNDLIVGAVLSQLLTKERMEHPNSRVVCSFGRAPALGGHLGLWGRVEQDLAISLTAASGSRDVHTKRNTKGTLV